MTHFLTRDCSCSHRTYTGQKRPDQCIHGNRFQTEAELNPLPRSPLPSVSPKRQAEEESGARPRRRGTTLNQGRGFACTPAQREKVKGKVCVSCKRDYYEEGAEIQPAHVYPRRLARCECAEGVVPLCASCHRRYDDLNDPFSLMEVLITAGYRAEIVHAFVHHDAPMGEVLRVINGSERTPAEFGAAA